MLMAKKKEIEEKVISEEKLVKIENFVHRRTIVEHQMKEIDFKLQLIRADMEMAKMHIKLKENLIRDYQRVIPDYKAKITSIKEEEREYMNEIKKELDIQSERWGFDPDTGLIKEDSE